MLRRAARLTSLAGFPLLILSAAAAFSQEVPLPAGGRFTPAVILLGGLFLVWVHLAAARGFRRLPFWFCTAAGSFLVVSVPAGLGISGHDGVTLLTGAGLLLAARAVMGLRRVYPRRCITVTAVCTLAALLLPALADLPAAGDRDLAYRGELDDLMTLLHPAAGRFREEAENYVEELAKDEDLLREEQERRIEELNRRIETLEGDLMRFEEVEREREQYAEEADRLRKLLEDAVMAEEGLPEADDLAMVTTYREAVRPEVPLVRDFAVTLASSNPGSYYRSSADMLRAVPGEAGVRQAAAIHRYILGQWKYVNDPLVISTDYYSPADRTIAAGLAGDCDDFAILLASCIEAVGGRARIMHGSCSDGGHAWCEVFIGDKKAWREALAVIHRLYPGRRISFLSPGPGQDYWLCLDWEIGIYSCGGSPTAAYESGWGYR